MLSRGVPLALTKFVRPWATVTAGREKVPCRPGAIWKRNDRRGSGCAIDNPSAGTLNRTQRGGYPTSSAFEGDSQNDDAGLNRRSFTRRVEDKLRCSRRGPCFN